MYLDLSVPSLSAIWLTVAILGGGFARTRNRSAFAWFLLLLFFGPISAVFLVVMAPAPDRNGRVRGEG